MDPNSSQNPETPPNEPPLQNELETKNHQGGIHPKATKSKRKPSWLSRIFWGFFWKLLAVLILAALLVLLWFALDLGKYWGNFWGRQEVLGARTQLLESLPQEDLITGRGRFTYIFPFDFWKADSFRRLRNQAMGIPEDSGETDLGTLRAIRDWARANNLDLIQPSKYFLIRFEVELGLDLEPGTIQVKYQDGEKILMVPEPELLSHRVLERDWRKDGFPDFELPIEQWRDLLEILEPELLRRSTGAELQQAARKGLERFLKTLLPSSDWSFEISSAAAHSGEEILLSR